ncbi:ABC-three component system protein [Dechloromonas denitrificans]|uniref:ABC-three component system protein n=1 Tax=Dechloromonas denitrificans TaxID=281362 RepID=UPI001CF8E19F|nr:ABC-three component system protein [Dechloromonas denitrificans]
MERSKYWDLCEYRLSVLCTRIEVRGKLNILNFHNHSENFYLHFLNELYGYKLTNMNEVQQNVEGIDLVDKENKIVIQVSSTATKSKINSALAKDLSSYKDYSFKFVSICKDASSLRANSYENPHNLIFNPAKDILDVPSLLSKIQGLKIVEQQAISRFLEDELDPNIRERFTETNLAAVINLIANEDLTDGYAADRPIPFNVDTKLEVNNLESAAMIIEDYKTHHHRVARIYEEFDTAGKNKSNSVLHALRTIYAKLSTKFSGDELFFNVVEQVIQRIQNSANFIEIPLDELEQYVNVLSVDAFIRCKIFKNPNEVKCAAS